MRRLKLLLSLVLTLAMVMSFVVFAYAAEDPSEEEILTFTVPYGDDEYEEVEAAPITANTAALTGGETYSWYYVEGVVQLDHTLMVSGECAVILMEDSVLEFTDSVTTGFRVIRDAGLGIYACDSGNGMIKTAEQDTVLITATGNAKFNLNGGNLYAAGTCIVANGTSDVCLYEGIVETGESDEYAIVLQDWSTGELTNAAIYAGGGGIAADCDMFTMYGGTIEAVTVGVQNTRGFRMFGGEISNCIIGIQNYGGLYFGGTARVVDNGTDGICANVDMLEGSYIEMEEPAEDGFAAGLFSESLDADSLTEISIMTGATEDELAYFTYDIEGTELYIQDGILYLGLAAEEQAPIGSAFSDSTGLIAIGMLVIIAAAAIILIRKRKTA